MSDTCGRVNSSSETRKTKRAEKNGAKKSKDLRGWGKFDLNTDRCGRGNFYNPKRKKLRIQKYPDTSGRGLNLSPLRRRF